jgi:FkbM family methyltransferase
MSQFGQDRYLETMVFKGYKKGFFVDVGAYDGIRINNTLYFEQNNQWTGINVEPLKDIFDKLCVNRPNSINLNYAICNNEGTAEFICNSGCTELLSGLKDNYDPRHITRLHHENTSIGGSSKLITVKTTKLETVFDTYNIKRVHYLSIDVEGAEFDVIKSINFDKVFIDVIGFENNYEDVSIPIINYLFSKGYIILLKSHDVFMINIKSEFNKVNLIYL